MLYVVCIACLLINYVKSEHTVRCNNDTNPSGNYVTLEPSPDGVGGRYVLQWCTAVVPNVIAWEFHIGYNTSCKPDLCRHYNYTDDKRFQPHSRFEENTNINLNCSHVCLSTIVDLIFEACYHIKNQLHKDVGRIASYDQLIYITNNFTNITTLKTTKPHTKLLYDDDYVTVMWAMGPVPANNFTVVLYNNSASESGGAGGAAGEAGGAEWAVTRNCSGAPHTVWCRLRLPPARYTLLFAHCAPWTYGALSDDVVSYDFNVTGRAGAGAGAESGAGAGAAWWGAAGACGALALCTLAALALRRARRPPPHTKAGAAEAAGEAVAAAGGAAGGVRVLLLYARDCPLLEAAARRLGELLRHVAGDGVYDLYLPATSAQAARAPAEWLRALLEREDVRVVLLQTPAAAWLYAAQLRQRGSALGLEQPLLSAGAARRRPHCADALLQLALRQLGEAAPHHTYPYRKYYVAEISGLEANVVPLLTPQRRYVLPAAAALLLRDVAEGAPPAPAAPPEALAQFERAVQQLQQYVRDNPHYLEDELLFL